MKTKLVTRLILQLACSFLMVSLTCLAIPQSDAGGASGKKSSGGGRGDQSATGQQTAPSPSSPSGRIEATMLAYESSDKIAAHIANQIKEYKVLIYDSQTFATLQTYDAYAAAVSTFELNFRMLEQKFSSLEDVPKTIQDEKPTTEGHTNFIAPFGDVATGVQTIVGILGALRSTSEFATQPVDFQGDALIAQVAHHLSGGVIVPKMVLLSNEDLSLPDVTKLEGADCASLKKTIPYQLGCLLEARYKAEKIAAKKGTKNVFDQFDKLFQAFYTTLMGASTNIPNKSPVEDKVSQQVNPPSSILSSVVQGRRLELLLNKDDRKSRILVLETTAAGGGSRIKHNFWVELFYTTPTPAFNGGAVVSYLLIDPLSNAVQKAEVLRFIVDYEKFHGKKEQTPPSNFH